MDPKWVEALSSRAYVFEKTGRFKEALRGYMLALKYNPKYRPAITGRERVKAIRARQGLGGFIWRLLG